VGRPPLRLGCNQPIDRAHLVFEPYNDIVQPRGCRGLVGMKKG